jgi:hypothetical protein
MVRLVGCQLGRRRVLFADDDVTGQGGGALLRAETEKERGRRRAIAITATVTTRSRLRYHSTPRRLA